MSKIDETAKVILKGLDEDTEAEETEYWSEVYARTLIGNDVVKLDDSDLVAMATFWLMREDVAKILAEVAENPISGDDSSCAFCQAYGDDPHKSDCAVPNAEVLRTVIETLKGQK